MSNKDKQHVKILTETAHMLTKTLDAEISYISSEEREGWILDKEQQARSLENGQFLQLISESDCRPIRVFRGDNGVHPISIAQINRECQADARTVVDEDSNGRDNRLITIGIALGVVLLVFLIVVWRVLA